jgi:hypothetical protein
VGDRPRFGLVGYWRSGPDGFAPAP